MADVTHPQGADQAWPESWPDLVLGVRQTHGSGRPRLYYELSDRHAARQVARFEKELQLPLEAPLPDLFDHLARHADSLEGIGAALADHLLPAELSRRLAERAHSGMALWILSDESHIPWELLRITDKENRGPFLAEAFDLSRWLYGQPQQLGTPLQQMALLAVSSVDLEGVSVERDLVSSLARSGERKVESVVATRRKAIEALVSNRFDGWHLVGHGFSGGKAAELAGMVLDEDEILNSTDLRAPGCRLRDIGPFFLLNTCGSAAGIPALSGLGGFAQSLVQQGAAVVIGTLWPIESKAAAGFTRHFYRLYMAGSSIAAAVRQARMAVREEFPGESTWLAYSVFAHPLTRLGPKYPERPAIRKDGTFLKLPWEVWNPVRSPPGAMLRADHGLVPFHGREEELSDLLSWCREDRLLALRLYTGPGGMGKTRLALEACERLRRAGWRTGFLTDEADDAIKKTIRELLDGSGPLLAVLDYAETRRGLLVPLLRKLIGVSGEERIRIILLSRLREEWWELLKSEGSKVGDLIAGPATGHRVLEPLARSLGKRSETFRIAAASFAEAWAKPIPEKEPENLGERYFDPVLMIHIRALGAVEGVTMEGEDGILDWLLNREKRFWINQAEIRKLSSGLLAGIARAACAAYLAGGFETRRRMIEVLEFLQFFKGQPRAVLDQVARLLHETYPGVRWVMPILPDLLGEHLLERELDDPEEREEIFNLVLPVPALVRTADGAR